VAAWPQQHDVLAVVGGPLSHGDVAAPAEGLEQQRVEPLASGFADDIVGSIQVDRIDLGGGNEPQHLHLTRAARFRTFPTRCISFGTLCST